MVAGLFAILGGVLSVVATVVPVTLWGEDSQPPFVILSDPADIKELFMALRLEETFELVEAELSKAGLLDYLRAGVFLCGGGARIPEIQKLAERVFQLPAQNGSTNSISGLKSALDQPEFATAIGLVKYGSFQQKRRSTGFSFTQTLRETFGGLLRKP